MSPVFRYFITALIVTALSHSVLSIPQQEFERVLNGGDGRIYGGQEAMPNEFPGMVYVKAFGMSAGNSSPSIQCAGSLISSRYVLTLGDCLGWANLKYFQVILGAHDLNETTEPSRVSVNSNRYSIYTLSGATLLLILLPSPLIFTPQIQPIMLPSVYDSYGPEETVTLIGWGGSNNISGSYNKPLQKVEDVKLLPNEMCNLASTNDKFFCTSGEGRKGVCGDNGGPVNYQRPGGNWTLMGVITTINDPCGNGGPSYHVRVQPFLEWIYNTTGLTNPDPNPTSGSSAPSTDSTYNTAELSSPESSQTSSIPSNAADVLSIHQFGVFAIAALPFLHFAMQSLLFWR